MNDCHPLIRAATGALQVRARSCGRGVLAVGRRHRLVTVLLVALLAAFPLSALAAPQVGSYVVQRGDTLATIASRAGVSMAALAQANGIQNVNLIYVGQVLVIPGAPGPTAAATTTADPTTTAATTSPATTEGSVYVVQRGDTLSKIAARYGISLSALMTANGIQNPDRIYVGQRLAVKAGTSAPQPAPSTQPSSAPTASRWIDIDLSTQRLTAYEGETAVFTTLVSTGVAGRRTPVGRFAVRTKLRAQTMSGPGYYLPNVPYVMYFAGANAIHGTYWHSNFGHPMSHGCVNLPTPAAGWLYSWASIGTPVVTHY
jgi:LysM repeat protein